MDEMNDLFPKTTEELQPKLSNDEAEKEAAPAIERELIVDEELARLHAAVVESLDMPISDMPLSHRHWDAVNALRLYLGKQ